MSAVLECTGLTKSFPGVLALSNVDFDLQHGEVHALVGENGAGKSTLMHILSGVHPPDSGTIAIDGQGAVKILDEREAQRLGIAIVYQERSLFNLMSIAENLFVNRQPVGRLGVIDWGKLHSTARLLLHETGLDLEPDTPLSQLSPALQQMVEIAKALSFHSRVFILDEPTAALTISETETLFRIIRQLKQGGVGVIYISHRLEEIFQIADRVTVLKDGCRQGTWPVAETTADRLVSCMVGREQLHERVVRTVPPSDVPALEVTGLSDRKLDGINLRAHAGEILGIAGLAGAGRTELALAIFGMRPFLTGTVRVFGRPVDIHSPIDAMAAGIGYLPEDRKELGLFLNMSVAENIGAARLDAFGGWKIVARRLRDTATRFVEQLRIATPNVDRPVGKLSGGNQQKTLLARWLLRDSKILIVDEPTRGIDVGAKAEIYRVLRELADNGKSVIVISSELPEVLAISDRILVMREGQMVAELPAAGTSEEDILRYAAIPTRTATPKVA